MTSILWLRQDLRLSDQAALLAAVERGPVVPLYVLDDESPGEWKIGGAQRWWLHYSLAALDEALRAKGSRLILRRGRAADEVARVAHETGAAAVHAIRHHEPWWVVAERELADRLDLFLHDGNHLAAPETVRSGSGQPYKIFTPFWRALSAMLPPASPLPAPASIPATQAWPVSDSLSDWQLLPTEPDWAAQFSEWWTPGEAGAAQALDAFADCASGYGEGRNLPAEESTSRLSPHLHFGEISPATIWHRLDEGRGQDEFRRELGWRDFAAATIARRPDYAEQPGRSGPVISWRTGPEADADFRAWTRGQTGYPIVDAGMRQLWATGWMHNRVRMIAASFLVKHLLIDWRRGERWFWDTLVDADYGNNSVNWQWIAGSGEDASLWSRIMAPLLQSEKFDAGDYIRRWVLELRELPDPAIHDPHEAGLAPPGYPEKLIEHRAARERALEARSLR